MGVDLTTYRCRIGSFVTWQSSGDGRNADNEQGVCVGKSADGGQCAGGGQGAGGMKFLSSFSKLIKLIGSLTFIAMLLLMAGVESNPGPTETFIFRYQYLLIEVGTEVLRRLFDFQVGHNFTNYLATHTPESGRLQHLINIHKITAEQENDLPPKDKNPTSSNFDVTLLAFLLRNICGLCPARDMVWINPATTDFSVEADIARLRICRNILMHRDTVLIPEQDFDDKWKELCQILTRLNKKCGIADLQSLIDEAKDIAIDKQLQERHDETLKAWTEMEDAISKVEDKVTVVEQGLAEVREEVASVRKEGMKLDNPLHEKGSLKDLTTPMPHIIESLQLRDTDHKIELTGFEGNSAMYLVKHSDLNKRNSGNSDNCKYDEMVDLQCLHVSDLFGDHVKLNECMVRNRSTLHTVCIEGRMGSPTLIPELPLTSLQHLTSLSLYGVKIQHNSLQNLVQFLSNKDVIKTIKLSNVFCDKGINSYCPLTLNLSNHKNLTSLCLEHVNILCNNVNSSSLKSITLSPYSPRSVGSHVFNCNKNLQLEHLTIMVPFMLDYETVHSLLHIKSLTLWHIKIPDDVSLQLHPDVTQVKIELNYVIMSPQCFRHFIESFLNNKSVIKIESNGCKITSVDGETQSSGELKVWESVEYMSEYLASKLTVKITCKDELRLYLKQCRFFYLYRNTKITILLNRFEH